MKTMRALLFGKGSLKFRGDYPAPEFDPVRSPDVALVRVLCAGVCATDLEISKGYMGFEGVLGHEFSGVVEECGDDRMEGRRVTGEINLWCGKCAFCKGGMKNHCPQRSVLGILGKDGAFADYLTLPVRNLHPLPDSITDEEGVFVEPLAAAFQITAQLDIRPHERIAVLGDGRLGQLCAQVLSLTECDLTVIGNHPEKLALLKARGIKTAIGTDGLAKGFDMAVDCTGSPDGFNAALGLVRPGGVVVLKTTVADRTVADLNRVVIDEITVIGSRCGPFIPAIEALSEKRVDVAPLISKIFPLEQGVEALEYAARKGVLKVVLRVGER